MVDKEEIKRKMLNLAGNIQRASAEAEVAKSKANEKKRIEERRVVRSASDKYKESNQSRGLFFGRQVSKEITRENTGKVVSSLLPSHKSFTQGGKAKKNIRVARATFNPPPF